MRSKTNDNHYALILAGGSGTRLYPRSRVSRPKQFQKLFGDKTLIEHTYDHIVKFIKRENIYLSTNQQYQKTIQGILPKVKNENYICEPCKKNTAGAIALCSAIIHQKNPKATIASVHSDHVVLNEGNYIQAIQDAFEAITKDEKTIVTIGIQPTTPHTGYGYIERENNILQKYNFPIYSVKQFVEKPDSRTAQKYLHKGTFYWNAGYFIYKTSYFLSEVNKYQPGIYQIINKIVENPNLLENEYAKLPDVPIDTAIIEKASNLKVIPADLAWSDVGSWDSVANLFGQNNLDLNGNYTDGLTILHDTHNSTILSSRADKLIATIGVDNLIVVETEDAILITQKGRSEEVRKIIDKIKEKKLDNLL